MKIVQPNCPTCRGLAMGTVDKVTCIANFVMLYEDGITQYAGGSDIDWNSQTPISNAAGEKLVTCGEHEWYTRITEDDDGEE